MLRTGFTVPKCPGPPRVTGATKTTVTLTWKAPEDNGGSQVQDYEAEVQPKSRAAMEGGTADAWMLVYQVGAHRRIIRHPAAFMLHKPARTTVCVDKHNPGNAAAKFCSGRDQRPVYQGWDTETK